MSNISQFDRFSGARFTMMVKHEFIEHRKSLITGGLSLLAVFMVVVSILLYNVEWSLDAHTIWQYYTDNRPSIRASYTIFNAYNVLAFVAAAVAGSMFLSVPLRNTGSRINWMMTPASAGEKFFARFLIYIVGYFMLLFVIVCLTDLFVLIVYAYHAEVKYFSPWIKTAITHFDGLKMMLYTSSILAVQSFFALGSTIWPKRTIVYTIIALFIIGCFYSVVTTNVAYIIFENTSFKFAGMVDDVNFVENVITFITCAIMLCVAVVNYAIAYMRMREWEIIKRW